MAKILVPFDHSENAFVALKQSLLIAKKNHSDIEVFHVIHLLANRDFPIQWTDEDEIAIIESIQEKIDKAKEELSLDESIRTSVVLQRGERVADEVLLRASDSDTVLIVMGTHGVTGVIDKLLGTNSTDVISDSKWPVLLIPPHWKETNLRELVVAIEMEEMLSVTQSIKDMSIFLHLPVRAFQMTGVIDTKDVEDRSVEGIPFKYVTSNLENTLVENLKEYTKDWDDAILMMYIHPRNFLKKLFGISYTQETAKIINVPLLSIMKSE